MLDSVRSTATTDSEEKQLCLGFWSTSPDLQRLSWLIHLKTNSLHRLHNFGGVKRPGSRCNPILMHLGCRESSNVSSDNASKTHAQSPDYCSVCTCELGCEPRFLNGPALRSLRGQPCQKHASLSALHRGPRHRRCVRLKPSPTTRVCTNGFSEVTRLLRP